MKLRNRSAAIAGVFAACLAVSNPAQAMDCNGASSFDCLSNHAAAELKRLSLTPNEDQAKSFNALSALSIFEERGIAKAVAAWEAEDMPVYDLILTLLLADRKKDGLLAAMAAETPFVADPDGKMLIGREGFAQMEQDLSSFYHGEENMVYSRACVSDDAFKAEIGGSAKMRIGACRAPYDKQMVQRAFGMMQLLRDVSRDDAVEATMQYAYRVPSCTVAQAIIEIAPTSEALGGDEIATWKVLDMATVCAAELMIGTDL